MGRQRRVIHFSGLVQGVAFRYTTLRAAADHEVTGYVRNLPDGRVEVVAEGAAEEVEAFAADVQGRMGHYIRKTAQQLTEPRGQYSGFDVRFA